MRRSRASGKSGAGGRGVDAAASPSLSFSIPLKDTAKPVAFPPRFRKHIALEFATRYLCEVGSKISKTPWHDPIMVDCVLLL